jgi:hypothetical protein
MPHQIACNPAGRAPLHHSVDGGCLTRLELCVPVVRSGNNNSGPSSDRTAQSKSITDRIRAAVDDVEKQYWIANWAWQKKGAAKPLDSDLLKATILACHLSTAPPPYAETIKKDAISAAGRVGYFNVRIQVVTQNEGRAVIHMQTVEEESKVKIHVLADQEAKVCMPLSMPTRKAAQNDGGVFSFTFSTTVGLRRVSDSNTIAKLDKFLNLFAVSLSLSVVRTVDDQSSSNMQDSFTDIMASRGLGPLSLSETKGLFTLTSRQYTNIPIPDTTLNSKDECFPPLTHQKRIRHLHEMGQWLSAVSCDLTSCLKHPRTNKGSDSYSSTFQCVEDLPIIKTTTRGSRDLLVYSLRVNNLDVVIAKRLLERLYRETQQVVEQENLPFVGLTTWAGVLGDAAKIGVDIGNTGFAKASSSSSAIVVPTAIPPIHSLPPNGNWYHF